jgi:hypothetical protein
VRFALLLASAALASIPAPAPAQTPASQGAPEAPGETPEETPGAASAEAPICTDRPTKSNTPCTVPEGDVQIEADVTQWTRASAAGVTRETILFTDPTVKYGVLAHLDVEVSWAPWEQVRTSFNGHATTVSSVGDLFLRGKWAAFDGEVFETSLIPYVKLPTASHEVGNGHVEGGLIAPVVIKLPAEFKLTQCPELDALSNADRPGAHLNVIDVIDLSRSLGKWTLYAEIWNDQDFAPTGTRAQTTFDVAASWLLTNNAQLDAGANFGLDRDAPQQQFYLGVSGRF